MCFANTPHTLLSNFMIFWKYQIGIWRKRWQLMSTSHFLFFTSKGNSPNVAIMNKLLQDETKFFGFTICKILTRNSHVENIISLVDKKICLLRLYRRFLTTFSSKQFYYQFIHCHLIKGIQIYYSLSPKYLRDSLYLCQKTAIWIIAKVYFLPPVLSSLCKRFSIFPLPTVLV